MKQTIKRYKYNDIKSSGKTDILPLRENTTTIIIIIIIIIIINTIIIATNTVN